MKCTTLAALAVACGPITVGGQWDPAFGEDQHEYRNRANRYKNDKILYGKGADGDKQADGEGDTYSKYQPSQGNSATHFRSKQMSAEERFEQDGRMSETRAGTHWADLIGDKGEAASCLDVPMMPSTFYAKRAFFALLNTVYFYDSKGSEIGYVRSWALDPKNLFGTPGATLYLKTDQADADEGMYKIHPRPGHGGNWNKDTEGEGHKPVGGKPQTYDGELTQEQYERRERVQHGRLRGEEIEQYGGFGYKPTSWTDHFAHGWRYSHREYIAVAHMHGSHEGEYGGGPTDDFVTIKDCQGNHIIQANKGKLVYRNAVDAEAHQVESSLENDLLITDLAEPPEVMIKLYEKEPCNPFPPFCKHMGTRNWILHGSKWQGEFTHKGLNLANGLLDVSVGAGASSDIRFLTLFSMFQYSNTRLAPCFEWAFTLFILYSLGHFFFTRTCCSYHCCCCGCNLCGIRWCKPREEKKAAVETPREEIDPLVSKDFHHDVGGGSFLDCCTRSGGRTGVRVAPLHPAATSEKHSH